MFQAGCVGAENMRPGNGACSGKCSTLFSHDHARALSLHFMPDEEWTLFMRKRNSASEEYSPKLYIGGKVAKYIYSLLQSGASIANINGQFMVTRTL